MPSLRSKTITTLKIKRCWGQDILSHSTVRDISATVKRATYIISLRPRSSLTWQWVGDRLSEDRRVDADVGGAPAGDRRLCQRRRVVAERRQPDGGVDDWAVAAAAGVVVAAVDVVRQDWRWPSVDEIEAVVKPARENKDVRLTINVSKS